MSEFSHPATPIMFSMSVTPMDSRGHLDEARIRAHLRRQIDAGVGIYLGSGGSGEGHALTIDELAQLYRIGVDECKGKVPVYCNPPEARSANEMLAKSRQAIYAGADLVQFYQLDAGHGRVPVLAEQEMYFRDLLEQIDHPVGISIHAAVGYLAPCSLVTKLCHEYPQIKLVNIPFGPSMSYLVELKNTIPDTIKIYVGMHNVLSGLALGAWGAQVTETNQVPHLCQAMIDEFVAGDVARAAETYAHVLRLTDVIDMGRRVSADGPKAALKALGFDVGAPRHPRVPVDDATVDKMRSAFARLGTLELEAEAAARRTARQR
ncbi:MAG: dihydrodipicolinate synthase family protein [Acidimicrobiales bacterium]